MKASLACFQARLETFSTKQKTRRASARSKKPSPNTLGWPLHLPSPSDLALAGFIWKPTSTSPDNVQCITCNRQLDGWEPSDNPSHEHLTHSPDCGFAINACIRVRNADPNRAEEDPMAQAMQDARRATFADYWPLDSRAGFPTVDQLVDAGWCYDPSPEHDDGVTCPYCSLSLDAWDAGDDPMDEHRRRASDCLFFALKELYHPVAIPFVKGGSKATKGKRGSTRSSTATVKKAATKASTKALTKSTRGKKAESQVLVSEQSDVQIVVQAPKSQPAKAAAKPPARSRKASKRTSTSSLTSTMSTRSTRQTRGTKRKSEDTDPPQVPVETRETKRTKRISDPPERAEWPSMSSALPESIIEGTPTFPRTPQATTPEQKQPAMTWDPVNIDGFFDQKGVLQGFISDVMVDAGLDKENVDMYVRDAGPDAKDVMVHAVKVGLTNEEKNMTVEQWVMYNAKRGEEKLRAECERLISSYDVEAKRALTTLDAILVNG